MMANPFHQMYAHPHPQSQDVPGGQISAVCQELLDQLQMDKSEILNMQTCLKELVRMSTELGPNWNISSFGSAASGFYTRFSDLDVTCYQTAPEVLAAGGEMMSARDSLAYLRPIIERHEAFQVTEVISNARIPLLRLQYQQKLDVDISFQNSEPLPNTQLLRAYARLSSVVRHMVILIKMWAKAEEVCGAQNGHLSSYAITLMTVYFLQVDPLVKLPAFPTSDFTGIKNVPAVADVKWHCPLRIEDLVCRFFEFYTTSFYWGYEVISPRLGDRLYTDNPEYSQLPGRDNPNIIHLEDPFLLHRNLNCVLGTEQYVKLCRKMEFAHQSLQMHMAPEGLKAALNLCHQKLATRQDVPIPQRMPTPQVARNPPGKQELQAANLLKQISQHQPQHVPSAKGTSPENGTSELESQQARKKEPSESKGTSRICPATHTTAAARSCERLLQCTSSKWQSAPKPLSGAARAQAPEERPRCPPRSSEEDSAAE